MKKRHINIPIFIPHLGCPNDCVFCNQRTISGVREFEWESVIPMIESALSTIGDGAETELAFFGGSFTGIDRDLMIKLLTLANSYLKQGRISSIRCSTRPDYINDEILDILVEYGVTTVELGLQSASDRVLFASRRGHTFEDEMKACRLIKDRGLRLGGQMMIGLPESSAEDEIKTAEFIASVGADEARIYPTIVFKSTELCSMAMRGKYIPLDTDSAVIRSAGAFRILTERGVRVLRIGLCDSENLHRDDTYYAGPNHAAMGELVIGEYYYGLIRSRVANALHSQGAVLTVYTPVGHMSKVIGQNKKNKVRLLGEFGFFDIRFLENCDIPEFSILTVIEERK